MGRVLGLLFVFAGCNALWQLDDLDYGARAATGHGGAGGAGQGGDAVGGSGGSGAGGGGGGGASGGAGGSDPGCQAAAGEPSVAVWAKQAQDGGDISVEGIAALGDAVVVASVFGASYDFGGGLIPADGGANGAVTRFDADGNHVWTTTVYGSGTVAALSVAAGARPDGRGDMVAVIGQYHGPVAVAGDPLPETAAPACFVALLDAVDGQLTDVTIASSVTDCDAGDIAVSDGRVAAFVDFQDDITVGSEMHLGHADSRDDLLVFVLDASAPGRAAIAWQAAFTALGEDNADSVVWVGDDVVIAGDYGGEPAFDDPDMAAANALDTYWARLDGGDGTLLDVRGYEGAGNQTEPRLAADANGFVLVLRNDGSVSLEGAPHTTVGGVDVVLARYAATGELVWSEGYGGPGDDLSQRVSLDSSGNILIALRTPGGIDFGGGTIATSPAGIRGVVAKLDSEGDAVWSRVLKLESQPGDIRIATLCDDSLAVGISFADMVDFGSAAFTAAEGFDLACGRLAP